MKICPFMSHMLGAEGNVLRIDSLAPRAAGDVVTLGYDSRESGGVKTELRPATKAKNEASAAASHLYCLRETCRFFRTRDGECTFDAILEGVNQQAKALAEVTAGAGRDKKDTTAATVTRELDKFWKFQTKSVSELIASFGDTEKRQSDSFAKLVTDLEKRIIKFMEDEDGRDERMNVIRDGVVDIKDTIDARNDGFETLTTTVSDLVMSFEDNLKELRTQWKTLAKRLDTIEGATGKANAVEENAAMEKMAAKIEAVDANVARTITNLDRMERNWGEAMDAVKSSKKKGDDPGAQNRRREAMKFNNLGVTSFHNGDLALARDQFLEAVNRDDTFAECYNNLGLVYTELGESSLAADAFNKAIKLNPELHAAYNNLGYVYYKQGDYERAIEMYNEALNRSSNNSSAYTNLGNAWFKLGDRKQARQAWEKAIELDPANETAQRSLKNIG